MYSETRWLVSCLRSLHGAAACSPRPANLHWEGLLTVAEAENLTPALGFALKAMAWEGVPAGVKKHLTRRLAEGSARHLLMSRELGRVLRRFAAEGVAVIPLKGPFLADTLYPHPALRPFSDVDLLIRPEDLLCADALLVSLGCRRVADDHSWSFDIAYDQATLYEGVYGVRVDLHWSVVNDPRYAWNNRQGLSVWDRAIPIRVAGEAALGLCPEDLLLYLAVHLAVHHGLAGLLWYWDLALILDRWAGALDWEAVIARASRWRVHTALFFALRELERVFGVSAPPQVMVRLRPRGLRAAALDRLLRDRKSDRLARLGHLISLLLVDRSRDLFGPFRQVFSPSAAWVRTRYEGVARSLPGQYLAHYRRMGEVMYAATGGLERYAAT